jgi:hypothetical protein
MLSTILICDATTLMAPFTKVTKTDEDTPGKEEEVVVKPRTMTKAVGDAFVHETAAVPLFGIAPTLEKHLMES